MTPATKWTEERCALAIARTLFPWRRHIVVPNLSWGMGINFEIDLGVLSSANWLTEVEIKVSLSDLRQDAKKHRHQAPGYPMRGAGIVRKRYVAMPADIWSKLRDLEYGRGAGVTLPEGVGRISITGDDQAKIIAPAKPIAGARRLRDDERQQMIRLGCIRYWALRESSVLANAGLTRAFEDFITRENATMFAGAQ